MTTATDAGATSPSLTTANDSVKPAKPLLTVRNLKKHSPIRKGFFGRVSAQVHAVDGVSFAIGKARRLASSARATAANHGLALPDRLIEAASDEIEFDGDNGPHIGR